VTHRDLIEGFPGASPRGAARRPPAPESRRWAEAARRRRPLLDRPVAQPGGLARGHHFLDVAIAPVTRDPASDQWPHARAGLDL